MSDVIAAEAVLLGSKGAGIAHLFLFVLDVLKGLAAGEPWAWKILALIVVLVVGCVLVDHFVLRRWREEDQRTPPEK